MFKLIKSLRLCLRQDRLFSTTTRAPSNNSIRAAFWRGGTSNGLMIAGTHLPEWQVIKSHYPHDKLDLKHCAEILKPFFRAAMGSPDPYGRQLNGMGGGLSSLSKAVIVDRSSDPQAADVDYLFVQIGIKDGELDLAGNCGNMSSAVGPFAVDEGITTGSELEVVGAVDVRGVESGGSERRYVRRARLRNLNTNRRILSDFWTYEAQREKDRVWFEERGNYVVDGVAGYASPIIMSFTSPGGSKTGKVLPTGNPTDELLLDNGERIQATLTDISNPGVFIDGRAIGLEVAVLPEALNANTLLMSKLEYIRRAGAAKMGLDPDTPSIPKVVMVFPAHSSASDVGCQALSMQQAHKAVPMTLALNLGVACKMAGTIPYQLARQRDQEKTVIEHPSGNIEVGAVFSRDGQVESAQIIRSARCLMRGQVNATVNEKLETTNA